MALTFKSLGRLAGKALMNAPGGIGTIARGTQTVRRMTSRPKAPGPTAFNTFAQALPPELAPRTSPAPAAPMGITRMGASAPASSFGEGYDRLDQAMGGWLPGGSTQPGSFAPTGFAQGGSQTGAGVLSGQVPIVTQVVATTVTKAPPGYVKVKGPNGREVAMLKVVAYSLGLRKRPTRRGGISGRDLRTAARVQKQLTKFTVARQIKGARVAAGKRK